MNHYVNRASLRRYYPVQVMRVHPNRISQLISTPSILYYFSKARIIHLGMFVNNNLAT